MLLDWLAAGSAPRPGAIAQLVERFHGMEEVRGSIPLSSTLPGTPGSSENFQVRGLSVPIDVERLHDLLNLVGGQRLHGVAQREHGELRGVLEFFDRVAGRFEGFASDDGAVVGQKDGGSPPGQAAHGFAHRRIARHEEGQQLHSSELHDRVRRERRKRVLGIDVGRHRPHHRVARMQVDDRSGLRAGVVERRVQGHLLRRGIAADQLARGVEARQSAGVESPERGPGRRDQEAPVLCPGRDVAG